MIAAACQPWAHQIELLQTIPGVGEKVAQVIVAETGADMSRFPSAAHLASWAGVWRRRCYESAGKRTPGRRPARQQVADRDAGRGRRLGRPDEGHELPGRPARPARPAAAGWAGPQVAVAHSILVSAYYMLNRDEPYQDLGADWLARRNDEAHTRRLVAQLERLGHTVVLDPAA